MQYLTDDLKSLYMTELDSPDAALDPGVRPYLDRINAFPFVCTTQCCIGHPEGAYLSLMVTAKAAPWFEGTAIPALTEHSGYAYKLFERVSPGQIRVRYVFCIDQGAADRFYGTLEAVLKSAEV